MTRRRLQIDYEEVKRLAGLGLTKAQIAANLGISERTLYSMQQESADFADAIKKGKIAANVKVANALYEKAMSGNVTAMIFWLKCRAGWTESQRYIIEEEDGKKPLPSGMAAIYEQFNNAARQTLLEEGWTKPNET